MTWARQGLPLGLSLAAASGAGVRGGLLSLGLVPLADRVPPLARAGGAGRLGGGALGIGGGFDSMLARPGPAFLDREAAAPAPALLGTLAAARVVLAGERNAALLAGSAGDGEADGGNQVADERDGRAGAPGECSPEVVSSAEPHGRRPPDAVRYVTRTPS